MFFTGSACTFEQDTCRWWNAGSSAYKWIRHQGATPDSNTGPAYDHTTLSAAGKYVNTVLHWITSVDQI